MVERKKGFPPKQGREFFTTDEQDFHRSNNMNFLPHRVIENIGLVKFRHGGQV
jgi:hypothetical protein